ncbi:hypothetical protein Syun_006628 [Stephania yunnanensis]|uniref:Uncharacterized protein n=1 Tax=Stephania yunnanensis TaxID=152371 RepID=A0AAP0KWW4_9MAGN
MTCQPSSSRRPSVSPHAFHYMASSHDTPSPLVPGVSATASVTPSSDDGHDIHNDSPEPPREADGQVFISP